MTDKKPADLTPEEAKAAREWATSYLESAAGSERVRAAARVVLATVPAPPQPTLADMTADERAACRWMQADIKPWGRAVIIDPDRSSGLAALIDREDGLTYWDYYRVTPRPDLPRLEWPGTEKPAPDPAPALPEGWRLADHPQHGPVVVTSMEPDDAGFVWFVRTDPYGGSEGYDAGCCKPDVLTFLAQGADQ